MGEPSEVIDVSVVIPTYNAAATIAEQLAALDRQTFAGEWEIVIALQPCTDGTEVVVARCASERVIVVDAFDRLGPSYARNAGVAAARGSLIAFCDADDIVADDWLAELFRHSSSPVVAGAAVAFDDGTGLGDAHQAGPAVPGKEYGFLQSIYTGSLLVHRSAFDAVGGFDVELSHCEDTDLAWRLQLAGYPIVTAPDAVIFYRQRASRRARWLQEHRWCRTVPRLYRRYRGDGMPRSGPRRVASEWFWLISRMPLLVRSDRRAVWLFRSARRTGYLIGSARERCLYL